MMPIATAKTETTTNAFIAFLFLAVLLVFAGCGTVPSEPGSVADPVVGCWRATTTAGTYGLTFDADGTCTYTIAKYNGSTGTQSCTWSIADDQLTTVFTAYTSTMAYAIDGDVMTLTSTGNTGSYTRVACAGPID